MDGAAVVLEPCAQSIAAGDGRELWQYLPGGQIASVTGKKCIAVSTGGTVILKGCDATGASQWEAQGSGAYDCQPLAPHGVSCIYAYGGQLRLSGAGQKCLSAKGLAAGTNVALKSAISASSSADTGAHGASMAVDGNSNTFWAHMKPTHSCSFRSSYLHCCARQALWIQKNL